jgi:hypothetical protein
MAQGEGPEFKPQYRKKKKIPVLLEIILNYYFFVITVIFKEDSYLSLNLHFHTTYSANLGS